MVSGYLFRFEVCRNDLARNSADPERRLNRRGGHKKRQRLQTKYSFFDKKNPDVWDTGKLLKCKQLVSLVCVFWNLQKGKETTCES